MAQQRNTANDVTPAFVGEIWERLTSKPHGPCCLTTQPCGRKECLGPDGQWPYCSWWWCPNDEWWIGCEAFPKELFPSPRRKPGQSRMSFPLSGNNRHKLPTISISRWSCSFHSENTHASVHSPQPRKSAKVQYFGDPPVPTPRVTVQHHRHLPIAHRHIPLLPGASSGPEFDHNQHA